MMKQLIKISQALLGVAALILATLVAAGRLTWRTIRNSGQKYSKRTRCLIAAFLALTTASFGALFIYYCHEQLHGRIYWMDELLSEHVVIHGFRDNKIRIYNQLTEVYTTPRINWVTHASDNDSLAVYAIPSRRGYLNTRNGEIVIDAERNVYQKAWVFSEGLAAVMHDGKVGFINERNEVVIPFDFEYSDKCRMWNLGYLFHDGYCIMTNKEGYVGLIDKSGRWVLEAIYDEIWAPHEPGYRVIIKGGKYGVIDLRGEVVYPAEYSYINILADGFELSKEGWKYLVDFDGNKVRSFLFDDSYFLSYPLDYEQQELIAYTLSDYSKYRVVDRYGIMNRQTGKPITPALYQEIRMLSKELFEVQDPESLCWHLLDTEGRVVEK